MKLLINIDPKLIGRGFIVELRTIFSNIVKQMERGHDKGKLINSKGEYVGSFELEFEEQKDPLEQILEDTLITRSEKKMSEDSHVEMNGTIVSAMGSGIYKVLLDKDPKAKSQADVYVIATLGGKMKQNKITILSGDKVKVKVSPYDMSRGFITWRFR
jgi:translation initiation factor IF-1